MIFEFRFPFTFTDVCFCFFRTTAHQILEPAGQVGEVVVTVKLHGYNKFVSQASRQHPVPDLSASLPIKLVKDAVLDPSHAILYKHKDNLVGGNNDIL